MENGLKMEYLDSRQPVEKRVNDLLSRMTLEEKLRQINMVDIRNFVDDKGKFSEELADSFFKGMGIGVVQDPRLEPEKNAEIVSQLQKYLKTKTRLGIPAIIVCECLHGLLSPKATIFPQAIGLAGTWNVEMMKEIASTIAKECRANGINQGLAPDLDLAREPRWGRVEETYGEDPYLCSSMGVAYIRGLQGENETVDNDHIISTIKHFTAHGSPEGGVNLSPVYAGERQLRELYLKPFEAAIKEAGALSVMPAYSEVDGIPCSASKMLLTKILRHEWNFKGYTFSDYEAINMLHNFHKTADSPEQAGKQALEAGMDLEAPGTYGFTDKLMELVRSGVVSEEAVDRAVSNILRVKFLAGLFEQDTYADPDYAKRITNCEAHRNLALKATHESIVLLKNENGLLPLDKNIDSIAVIGPNADVAQLGDYSMIKKEAVTPLQGIRNRASVNTEIYYAKGCGLYEQSKDGFAEAVEAARKSKVAVLVVGEASMLTCGVGWGSESGMVATCGEGFDRTDLELPGVQQELVEEIVKTGVPTVVVLVNGRPLSISWIAENVPAILEAWYPGEEGGNGLADILFGNVNPSGKLPVSFPKTVGQLPVYYNHKPSARGFYHMPGSLEKPGRDYVFMDTKPLFGFGHGLSYTQFEYSDLKVSPEKIRPHEKVTVTVNIKNVGSREGKEVVQLYITDLVSSVTTPVKELQGFKKVCIRAGETKQVSFTLTGRNLSLIGEDMKETVEPGYFEVSIGGLKKRFEVISDC
jgi:beta-glucosidase